MLQRKVSLIVFYNDKKEILLQNRDDYKNEVNKWWFFWWWIEYSENPKEAVIRETKEELCFDLVDFNYLWNIKKVIFHKWEEKEIEAFVYISYKKDKSNFELKEWKWMQFFDLNKAFKLNMTIWLDEYILEIVRWFFESK